RNDTDLRKELDASGIRLLVMNTYRRVRQLEPSESSVEHPVEDRKRGENTALKILASRSGGSYTYGISETQLHFAAYGYLFVVKLPAGPDKFRGWTPRLRGNAAKAHPNPLIYYPEQLGPCTAPGS